MKIDLLGGIMRWGRERVFRALELPRKPLYSGKEPLFSSSVASIPVLLAKRVG